MSKNDKLVFDADDTSLIITGPNSLEFSTKVHTIFANIIEWFRSNLMSLNFDKTHFLQFGTKYSQKLDLNIRSLNKHISTITGIRFLGLSTDDRLSWKCHINHILIDMAEHHLLCY